VVRYQLTLPSIELPGHKARPLPRPVCSLAFPIMKFAFLVTTMASALLLSGCVFPGDAIIRPVTLQGYLPDSEVRSAFLVQLDHHASRNELIAFATHGMWWDFPAHRSVRASIVKQHFTANFGSFITPALVWVLPPLGSQTPMDILIRVDSVPARTFVYRNKKIYRVSTSTGALTKCVPETVRCSGSAVGNIKSPMIIQLQLLP